MQEFTLYILYSELKDKFYVGFTSDLMSERLRRHNSNHKGFTGISSDWIVVYVEVYFQKLEAQTREKQIKKWKSRKMIESLIS